MQEMDVDGRDARFENRVGYRRFPSACRKSSGTSSGVSNVFFPVRSIPKSLKQSSQSDSMKSNDGVPEGSGSKRRVKARSFSRFRHPEKRVRSDSFGTGQHIPFSPGLQIRFRRNANPIVGTVIRIGVQDGS